MKIKKTMLVCFSFFLVGFIANWTKSLFVHYTSAENVSKNDQAYYTCKFI